MDREKRCAVLGAQLKVLRDAGLFLKPVQEKSPGVFVGSVADNWAGIAYELATVLPGQFWATETGASWNVGGTVARIMSLATYHEVLEAQDILSDLGINVPASDLNKWSVGGVCRYLLRWVAPCDMKAYTAASGIMLPIQGERGGASGYHECVPGEYEYTEHWDVKAYYWSMLERAKSLQCSIDKHNRLRWEPVRPHTMEQWHELLVRIRDNKTVRNILTGCALGSDREMSYWKGDGAGDAYEVFLLKRNVGAFRSLAELVIYSGYEMTRKVCEEMPCLYANMDCIVTPTYTNENTWERRGFEVKMEDAGPTDIRRRGWYKVGGKATEHYSKAVEKKRLHLVARQAVEHHAPLPYTLFAQWL